jgi:ribonucleoside-diphosphate reductase alpha chain
LALDYLPFETRAGLGIFTAEERQRQLDTGSYEEVEDVASVSEAESLRESPAKSKSDSESGSGDEPGDVVEETAKPAPKSAHTSAEVMESLGTSVDAPLCFTCGTKMRPAGSCFVCEGCGSTSGCS